MIHHPVRSLIRIAMVVATFASASSALAHGVVPYPAPRDIQHDDVVEWTADVVGIKVESTQSDVTVTTTLPESLPYIYAIEILLFCSDGTTSNLLMDDGWVLEGGTEVTRSCENSTFEAAGVTIYAVDDHGGEEHPVDEGTEQEEP